MEMGLDESYQQIKRVVMGLCGVEVLWPVIMGKERTCEYDATTELIFKGMCLCGTY
jgi:hypothetical protein